MRLYTSMGNRLILCCLRRRHVHTPPNDIIGEVTQPFQSLAWSEMQNSVIKNDGLTNVRMSELARVNIVTFNLLAPCYKRMSTRNAVGRRHRESHDPKVWAPRADLTFNFFKEVIIPNASIIALQEFWLGNQEYKRMFLNEFERQGYSVHTVQRTGDKMDAVALVVKRTEFEILGHKNVNLFSADRIALLLWLQHKQTGKNMIIANTHLSFPHTALDRMLQMRQMNTLEAEIAAFEVQNQLTSATRVVVGDFNVEAQSPVCASLRRSGYVSGMDIMDEPLPVSPAHVELSSADHSVESKLAYKRWISHRTHRSEDLGVDHVFMKPEIEWSLEGKETVGTLPESSLVSTPLVQTSNGSASPIRKATGGVFIDSASVLPAGLCSQSWPQNFAVSDHRPVKVSLVFGRAASPSQK